MKIGIIKIYLKVNFYPFKDVANYQVSKIFSKKIVA